MTSLTGKFASKRGWALLLILLLGGGFLVTACGEEDTPAPTTPAPPPPPPAPPAPEPPGVPEGLRVSASGESFIEWSWTAVEGADAYDVQLSLDAEFDGSDPTFAITGTSFRSPLPLPAGTTAHARVRSASGEGGDRLTSEWSAGVTGMTAAPAPVAPGTPSGLEVTDRGEDFIEWSWNEVAGATGYQVQFSENDEFTDRDPVTSRDAQQRSYRKDQLEPETEAYVRVRAVLVVDGSRLESGWSEPVSGMTTAPALTAPPTPTGLRVSASGEDFVEWSWSEVAGAAGYRVEYSRNEQFTGSTTDDVDADTLSYRVADLPSDTNVYLRVRAFVGTGDDRLWSDWSIHRTGMTEPPAAMAPDTPTIADVRTGEDFIEWSWNAVSGAEGYEVQFSLDGQFSDATTVDLTADQRSYQKDDLDPETRGYLRVRAFVTDEGQRLHSMWSEAATAVTDPSSLVQPAAPQNLRVTDKGPDFIEWSWDAVPEVAGYEVRYSDNAAITGDDPIVKLSAETLSYRKEGLTPDTEHYLQVRAYVTDGTRRLESRWVPSRGVSGSTDPAKPAAPKNLRVDSSETDHDSIGWEWDPVEGATGYESQFSLDDTFDDETSGIEIHNARTTDRQVHNRDPRTNGYLRVRSVVGTGSAARKSDWSETSTGRTTDPPAAQPLSAPTGVSAGSATNTSITVTWNKVESAASYEVEQRVAGGSWVAADCGGGSAVVQETECQAAGLARGTEYSFRVYAVPDSSDTTRQRSAPATLGEPVRTTGSAQRPPPTAGAGALNVTWRSQMTTETVAEIHWRWDQAGDVDYQVKVLEGVQDESKPCEERSGEWSIASGSGTTNGIQLGNSHRRTISNPEGNEARVLCVRSTWLDSGKRQYGEDSWAWAAVPPKTPARPDPYAVDLMNGVTESLKWNVDLATTGELQYDFRYLVDKQDDANDFETLTTANAQSQCESADSAETLIPGGSSFTTFTTSGTLTTYAAYHLCYRAQNDSGRSNWAVASDQQIYTAPAKPTAGSPSRKAGNRFRQPVHLYLDSDETQ